MDLPRRGGGVIWNRQLFVFTWIPQPTLLLPPAHADTQTHMQEHMGDDENLLHMVFMQFLEEKDNASMFIVYNHPFLSHFGRCCYLSLNSALV